MKRIVYKIADVILSLAVYPAALLLRLVRLKGVGNLPLCKRALIRVGVFPIRNHYYEPQFDLSSLSQPLSAPRALCGIDWNVHEQLSLLRELRYGAELSGTPKAKTATLEFYLNNGAFQAGDAEYWYQLIRFAKPRRILEIGSGNSTLMAVKAIAKNRGEDPSYACHHVCIEPFEMPWLEQIGVSVVRKAVEEVGVGFFEQLEASDILFIDSSHVIRPQGDVLFEYLELLPTLKPGVIVHVHDIFSPRNYPRKWLVEDVLFWNEQYLLEAFLNGNTRWKILGALNYLQHDYHAELAKVCPFLKADDEPGSFYMRKIA